MSLKQTKLIDLAQDLVEKIKAKTNDLRKKMEEKEFEKGKVLTVDDKMFILSEDNTDKGQNALISFGKSFGVLAYGPTKIILTHFSNLLLNLGAMSKSKSIIVENFSGFPAVSASGLVICYSHFYLETIEVQKIRKGYFTNEDYTGKRVICLTMNKTVAPQKIPQNLFELGSYIEASPVEQKDKTNIRDQLWKVIVLSIQGKQAEIKKEQLKVGKVQAQANLVKTMMERIQAKISKGEELTSKQQEILDKAMQD